MIALLVKHMFIPQWSIKAYKIIKINSIRCYNKQEAGNSMYKNTELLSQRGTKTVDNVGVDWDTDEYSPFVKWDQTELWKVTSPPSGKDESKHKK